MKPMKRKPLVAGNWKMNKTVGESLDLVKVMLPGLIKFPQVERVICPPFIALEPIAKFMAGSGVYLGAQYMHWEESGAYTGEVSPLMLKDLCTYVIVGHSERRAYFNETDETVNCRVQAALKHDLQPIVCVGETLDEREAGMTAAVVHRQITEGLAGVSADEADLLVIAYEPIWAIGTGKAATAEDANTTIADTIRPALVEITNEKVAQSVQILYGGSVKPTNAAEFFIQAEIDGALVGGASLRADDFLDIVAAAQP